jgi:hypothetical protein
MIMVGCMIWVELGGRDMNYDCSNSRLFAGLLAGSNSTSLGLVEKECRFRPLILLILPNVAIPSDN